MWKNLRGALLVGNGFLPSDFSRTRVRLRAVGGSLEFNTEPNVDVRGEATAAVKVLARRLRRTGAIIIPGSLRIMPAGADFHYGATLPHGHDGPNGTDMLGQLRGVPGLHVVDGSVLPRLSSRHPTLTIMANADRIARMVRDAL
jgi:choline dehydrogenase-like flavoprotein